MPGLWPQLIKHLPTDWMQLDGEQTKRSKKEGQHMLSMCCMIFLMDQPWVGLVQHCNGERVRALVREAVPASSMGSTAHLSHLMQESGQEPLFKCNNPACSDSQRPHYRNWYGSTSRGNSQRTSHSRDIFNEHLLCARRLKKAIKTILYLAWRFS